MCVYAPRTTILSDSTSFHDGPPKTSERRKRQLTQSLPRRRLSFPPLAPCLLNLRAGGAIEMQIDLVTIQRHAGEKLRKIENQPNPAQRLIALKKFLKIETQRL